MATPNDWKQRPFESHVVMTSHNSNNKHEGNANYNINNINDNGTHPIGNANDHTNTRLLFTNHNTDHTTNTNSNSNSNSNGLADAVEVANNGVCSNGNDGADSDEVAVINLSVNTLSPQHEPHEPNDDANDANDNVNDRQRHQQRRGSKSTRATSARVAITPTENDDVSIIHSQTLPPSAASAMPSHVLPSSPMVSSLSLSPAAIAAVARRRSSSSTSSLARQLGHRYIHGTTTPHTSTTSTHSGSGEEKDSDAHTKTGSDDDDDNDTNDSNSITYPPLPLSIMPVGSPAFGSIPSIGSPSISLNDKIEQSAVEAAEAAAAAAAAADSLEPFIQLCGPLFIALQSTVGTGRTILRDSKTFPDAIARSSAERILTLYQAQSLLDDFDLNAFMLEHFILPEVRPVLRAGETHTTKWASSPVLSTVEEHICTMWNRLTRRADAATEAGQRGTLLRLPHAYIVPGGRFREIYYWDSYFTCLGLSASDIPSHSKLIRAMTDNFSFVIDTYGHIPNGNRQYYRSRSQPPFFCHLVQLLCQQTPNKGLSLMDRYAPRIEKEYRFWMNGADALSRSHPCHRRVVLVHIDGISEPLLLNRYWDDAEGTPRPEAWVQDTELAHAAIAGVDEEGREAARNAAYRHIRAAAESGWDFSSRWFSDGRDMKTICTTDIIPVDLNCLLLHMEWTLSQYYMGIDNERAREYEMAATRRRFAIHRLLWNHDRAFFFDFNIATNKQMDIWTLAGAFPLWVGATECTSQQAKAVAVTLKSKFLQAGGWVTTWRDDDLVTGQQWDYPNGWAPLQWIVTQGLRSHGEKELAMLGANRWLATNRLIFRRTHKMMEKYNVVDLALEGGGGEYSLQTGFGWTNGVYSALQALNEIDKSSLTCVIPPTLSPRIGLHGNDSPYNGSPSKRRPGPSSRALGSIGGSTPSSSSSGSSGSHGSHGSPLRMALQPLDIIEQVPIPSLSLTDNATITNAFTCAPPSVVPVTAATENDTKRMDGHDNLIIIAANGSGKYDNNHNHNHGEHVIASISMASPLMALSSLSPSPSPSPSPPLSVIPSHAHESHASHAASSLSSLSSLSSSSATITPSKSLQSSMNILASISLRGVVPSPSMTSISSVESSDDTNVI